ncbi:MAG: response regulator [Burkholderiaceae bacterium]
MATVLVIEDEALIRENLMRFLALEGYTARCASDGQAGLEAARADPPDLILCDVMMPRMNGFDVLQALLQDPLLKTIPFFFLSASAEREKLEAGMALGAAGYVTKPFDLMQLRDVLRRVL